MALRRCRDHVPIAVAGKGLVGLVHHHQAAHPPGSGDGIRHGLRVPGIRRGVVGIGQVDQGRLPLGDGLQHGCGVQRKIGQEGYAHKIQPLELRAHRVHDKAGFRRQHHGPAPGGRISRSGAGQGQQGNQFIRAIAQHQRITLRHAGLPRQGLAQQLHAPIGVAIQGGGRQALGERCL